MKLVQKQNGFTLIELLVTIVLLGIIATSLSSLFLTIQQTQQRTNYAETANRAGMRQIELLRNNNFNALIPGETIEFTDQLPNTLPLDKNASVAISEPMPGIRRADVTITYSFNNRVQTVQLSSLIGVIGLTQ